MLAAYGTTAPEGEPNESRSHQSKTHHFGGGENVSSGRAVHRIGQRRIGGPAERGLRLRQSGERDEASANDQSRDRNEQKYAHREPDCHAFTVSQLMNGAVPAHKFTVVGVSKALAFVESGGAENSGRALIGRQGVGDDAIHLARCDGFLN